MTAKEQITVLPMNLPMDNRSRKWTAGAWLLTGALLLCAGCDQKPPSHGTEFVVQVGGATATSPTGQEQAIKQTAGILKKRLDTLGVRNAFVQSTATNSVVIQLPVLSAAVLESARSQVARAGFLQFRLVHKDSADLAARGVTPEGYEVLQLQESLGRSRGNTENLVVKKEPERGITGNGIKCAVFAPDDPGKPKIAFELHPEEAAAFAEVTRANVGERLAILIDGEVYAAPRIMTAIKSGSGIIEGRFDLRTALELANALESPLPGPVRIISERSF